MSATSTFKSGTISLEENGIVYFRSNADEVHDKQDLITLLDMMEEANNGKPFLLMMLVKEHQFLMTKEARNFFNTYKKAEQLIMAEAVVINSTPTRILYNLLTKLHSPKFPFKAFSEEADAVNWLNTCSTASVNNS
ncbi:MAG: hypothetical protein H6603_06675 [Flavobacteriales bacterium]|nr:hypothetical protein [Flavobacteriales bacterium]MCB9190398.1 hypothetical protein [Flavobacteriales bacterium]MCB9204647.1 hypothetical protein [Flavobacteriales bacterium]